MPSYLRTICLGLLLAAAAPCGWIWTTPDEAAPKNRFTYFRKVVTLERVPASATLLLSADSNARLWINGRTVVGKVTRYHEDRATADSIDAAPYLHPWQNVIVVLHHNWGPIVTFQRSANKHAGLYGERLVAHGRLVALADRTGICGARSTDRWHYWRPPDSLSADCRRAQDPRGKHARRGFRRFVTAACL